MKVWDLKDVEEWGNQGLHCSGCNWCFRDDLIKADI